MIEIVSLDKFNPEEFVSVASGYSTTEMYRVSRRESEEETVFSLKLESLPLTQLFRFPFSEEELDRYAELVPGDFCVGALSRGRLAGVALAEPQPWNRTLWVWEFHVAEAYRGKGIGRRLMAELAARARRASLRAIVCETQNTNVPAIRFYRRMGFTIEGVDISYYTNEDLLPGGTVAVFMKLRLE